MFEIKRWPTTYKVITQNFGARPDYYAGYGLPGHEGIDIRAYNGTNIYAVCDGTVYRATSHPNYGNHVRIQHDNGFKTIYCHLSICLVKYGQAIRTGEIIGLAGSTGNSKTAHLHFMMKHDQAGEGQEMHEGYPYNIIDPTPYLDKLL